MPCPSLWASSGTGARHLGIPIHRPAALLSLLRLALEAEGADALCQGLRLLHRQVLEGGRLRLVRLTSEPPPAPRPDTYPFLTQFSIPELTLTLLLLPHPPRPDWQVTDWVPLPETLWDMLLPQ